MAQRTTIARPITARGTALHAGVPVMMTLAPAPPGAGVIFSRTDIGRAVPARWDLVGETRLGMVIGLDGASIGMVEHLMAAVAEIDDLFSAHCTDEQYRDAGLHPPLVGQ
jgi:UDP-3-O-[3-hydroxymyristoyl] N-acetylglucosamine deacetylase